MTNNVNNSDFYVVIPAGGSGTRLWPVSRKTKPKFLFDLTNDGKSLIQATYDRLTDVVKDNDNDDKILIVTGEKHKTGISEQLPGVQDSAFITEPSPKDSMAAIALAAAVLQKRHGDVIMGSFAADQVIKGGAKFATQVNDAIVTAREGYVVTIGIMPSTPSTAFGYIEADERLSNDLPSTVLKVKSFTEKPDATTAGEYLRSGSYFWNAGMFIAKTSTVLDALKKYHPELSEGVEKIAQAWDTDSRNDVLSQVWDGLEKIAIDYAIIEPLGDEGKVAAVPATFTWSDIGDFDSVGDISATKIGETNVILGDDDSVISLNSEHNVVYSGIGRKIVLIGVEDFAVVDTDDVLLVMPRSNSQDVKKATDKVNRLGFSELL
jgi:mannose-1-phosphate guanylyltransferase